MLGERHRTQREEPHLSRSLVKRLHGSVCTDYGRNTDDARGRNAAGLIEVPDGQHMRFCADLAFRRALQSEGWAVAALEMDAQWKADLWGPAVEMFRDGGGAALVTRAEEEQADD